ncbi:histidine kinase [Cohnella boryungensis]
MHRIYRNYVRNNWFVKLILVYAGIAVLTIATLSYFAYVSLAKSIVDNKLDDQKNAMKSVDQFIESKYDAVQLMLQSIYRDQQLSDNVSYLLKNSYENYVSYRLDKFVNSANGVSKGLDFFKDRLEDDPDIENIILYSAEKQFLFVNDQHNLSKLVETKAARSYVPDAMILPNMDISTPNEWVRKAIGQWKPELIAVQSVINDMATYKMAGQLIVYYNSEAVTRALANYGESLPGYILALTPDGKVLFDSSGQYYGDLYPYASRIYGADGSAALDQDAYVSMLNAKHPGYVVVGIVPKAELAAYTQDLMRLIILIAIAGIFVAILIPSIFVLNFAKRVNRIIRSMRKVETGDMTVRIQDAREDELGQISRGFNDMLDELTRYIERVYKAEISQKQTELSALQARIHPHFLYNTLEVIRMRAVSQGVHDVGDMIYSLAGLFKSFVQSQAVVTLQEELDNCRKYLELFRIRYKDKFQYAFHADSELHGLEVAKMSLQPLIENYIVHGLRTDRDDNRIEISIVREEDRVRIDVRDNGNGIAKSRLEEIRQVLRFPEIVNEKASFGLRSVNERLQLMHGKPFGVEIDSEPGQGTSVTVWFPAKEWRENTNVSRLSG